jgi:hypothetical protein
MLDVQLWPTKPRIWTSLVSELSAKRLGCQCDQGRVRSRSRLKSIARWANTSNWTYKAQMLALLFVPGPRQKGIRRLLVLSGMSNTHDHLILSEIAAQSWELGFLLNSQWSSFPPKIGPGCHLRHQRWWRHQRKLELHSQVELKRCPCPVRLVRTGKSHHKRRAIPKVRMSGKPKSQKRVVQETLTHATRQRPTDGDSRTMAYHVAPFPGNWYVCASLVVIYLLMNLWWCSCTLITEWYNL